MLNIGICLILFNFIEYFIKILFNFLILVTYVFIIIIKMNNNLSDVNLTFYSSSFLKPRV